MNVFEFENFYGNAFEYNFTLKQKQSFKSINFYLKKELVQSEFPML